MTKLSILACTTMILTGALSINTQAEEIPYSGEVLAATGAMLGLISPIPQPMVGSITYDDAAIASGLAGPADILGMQANIGAVCIAMDITTCAPGTIATPVTNIDAAAVTFANGVPTGGTMSVVGTLVDPIVITLPVDFDFNTGTWSADGGVFGTVSGSFAPTQPPNIIVFQLDDLSMATLQTLLAGGWLPNINTHLVEAGVTFENSFVTNPESSASRVSFLTGQYAHNHQVLSDHSFNALKGAIAFDGWLPENGQPGREDSTVANWLRDAGYRTGFVGKYLSGYGEQAPAGVDPTTYIPSGWSMWKGLLSPSTFRVYDYNINENGSVVHYGMAETDYQTDVLAGHAADFLVDPAANPIANPFFLVVAPLAPHVEVLDLAQLVTGNDPLGGLGLGIRPAPRHAHLIDGDESNGELPSLPMKPSFNEADVSSKPSCPRATPPIEPALISDPACIADRPLFNEADIASLNNQYKSMLAAVIAVDDMVGSVIDGLIAAGKLDDTAIIFTSGSGWSYGEHRLIGKDLAYEESIRVPFIMRAPGGKTLASSSALIINNDIAPTLADLAGVTPPYQPDGASIMPLVDVAPDSAWIHRQRFLVERWYIPSLLKFDGPTYLAMRQLSSSAGNLSYIASHTDPAQLNTVTHRELYDMTTDPHQLVNITLPENFATSLNSFLLLFSGCSADSCKTLESF